MNNLEKNILPELVLTEQEICEILGFKDDVDETYVKLIMASLSKIIRNHPARNNKPYLKSIVKGYKEAKDQF